MKRCCMLGILLAVLVLASCGKPDKINSQYNTNPASGTAATPADQTPDNEMPIITPDANSEEPEKTPENVGGTFTAPETDENKTDENTPAADDKAVETTPATGDKTNETTPATGDKTNETTPATGDKTNLTTDDKTPATDPVTDAGTETTATDETADAEADGIPAIVSSVETSKADELIYTNETAGFTMSFGKNWTNTVTPAYAEEKLTETGAITDFSAENAADKQSISVAFEYLPLTFGDQPPANENVYVSKAIEGMTKLKESGKKPELIRDPITVPAFEKPLPIWRITLTEQNETVLFTVKDCGNGYMCVITASAEGDIEKAKRLFSLLDKIEVPAESDKKKQ